MYNATVLLIMSYYRIETSIGQKLTRSFSRAPTELVVWIYDTFGDNLDIYNDFTKYLKDIN